MPDFPAGVLARHLESVVAARLREEPVVVLTGARTTGKSTLVKACAARHAVRVVDLDDPATRTAVAQDPALFVRDGDDPVCIDEFQHVLPVLDAIKSELNRDLRPGRFLLTGSTRYSTLPATSQSLTGRAHVMTLWPLSQGELRGHKETFLEHLLTVPESLIRSRPSGTRREEYEQIVLTGGLPLAVSRRTPTARERWFRDYIRMVVERDVLEIRRVRQRHVLPQILRHLASQTGQILNASAVAAAQHLERNTVNDFVQLLEAVFLVHRLQAFGRTLSSRVTRSPKVHLVDSGLAAHLLGVTHPRLAERRPATLAEFGHLLETFCVNEILKQAGWSDADAQFSHFRTKDGHEVDLVCEMADGRVAAVEVKAAATVTDKDFRGLRMLRDKIGSTFVGGVVLCLGPHSYRRGDRLCVLPVDRIWTS